MSTEQLHTTNLFGLSIVAERFATVLEKILNHTGKTLIIFTPNPEQIVQAEKDQQFHDVLSQADLLLPDGAGLVIASRVFAAAGKSVPIPERITGIDLVNAVLKHAKEANKKVLVIGGRGYESQDWEWLEGYHSVTQPTEAEEKHVVETIKKLKPDFVFIAFGAPHQERWLLHHRELLEEVGAQVGLAVGGTFDIITGKLQRAPEPLRKLNLEWLYRLIQEPWRWRRQTKLLLFVKGAVQQLLK